MTRCSQARSKLSRLFQATNCKKRWHTNCIEKTHCSHCVFKISHKWKWNEHIAFKKHIVHIACAKIYVNQNKINMLHLNSNDFTSTLNECVCCEIQWWSKIVRLLTTFLMPSAMTTKHLEQFFQMMRVDLAFVCNCAKCGCLIWQWCQMHAVTFGMELTNSNCVIDMPNGCQLAVLANHVPNHTDFLVSIWHHCQMEKIVDKWLLVHLASLPNETPTLGKNWHKCQMRVLHLALLFRMVCVTCTIGIC